MENATPNLYDAIGVNADASSDKIKKRVRKLVHEVKESDKRNSEKNDLIRFFKSARDTLTDACARKEYDHSIGIETISTDLGDGNAISNVAGDTTDTGDTAAAADDDRGLVPHELQLSPRRPPFQAFGALGALGGLGSLFDPVQASPRSSRSSPLQASSLLSLLGSDAHDMFSRGSIVPEELSSSARGDFQLKPGTFQILEYTKVRNATGGFDEFGFTRQGDVHNDRVTEKRFERKS